MILIVISGFIGASIAYNNAKDGPTIHNKIRLGIIVQIISNVVPWLIFNNEYCFSL